MGQDPKGNHCRAYHRRAPQQEERTGGKVEVRQTAEALVGSMRGTTVPADVFDAAMQARTAYRKTKGGK